MNIYGLTTSRCASVEAYVTQAARRGPYGLIPVEIGWKVADLCERRIRSGGQDLSIRKISALTGVSRSWVHRLAMIMRSERNERGWSALRRRFGHEPLAVGLGLKMLDAGWREIEVMRLRD